MSRNPRSRRPAALLAAVALHGLLAALVVSRSPGPVAAEPRAVDVTLIRPLPLSPRARRPAPRPRLEPHPPGAAPRASTSAAPSPSAEKNVPPADNWRVHGEDSTAETARAALRKGVGCRTADLLALTAAEREACRDELAKGSRDAPVYAVVSPKLKKVFDGTFECPKGDVWCEYRIGKAPYPGLFAPHRKPRDPSWD